MGVLRYALAPHIPACARGLGIPLALGPEAGGVAVTFDDGPHPEGTPAVLEVLARAGVKATFFLVGEQVERRPSVAASLVAAGHGVAVHGYRHRLQLRLGRAAVEADLDRALAAIEDATGVRPRRHRPPYGVYSPAGLAAARERGLEPLLWSAWGKDWRRFTTPARIARRVTASLASGDVILLHDADFYSARGSHRHTVAALEMILARLGEREIGTVTVV